MPFPLTFTRFAVPRCVLILGMSSLDWWCFVVFHVCVYFGVYFFVNVFVFVIGMFADVRCLLVRRRGFVFVMDESRRAERRLPRGEDEEHVLAFELCVALDDRAVREIDGDAIEQPFAVRRVGDLATA